jgi:hypothetical protein
MDEHAQAVCRCLRHKGYYQAGVREADLVECAPSGSCWCAHTVTILGPDDILCSPEVCQPGRACYQA